MVIEDAGKGATSICDDIISGVISKMNQQGVFSTANGAGTEKLEAGKRLADFIPEPDLDDTSSEEGDAENCPGSPVAGTSRMYQNLPLSPVKKGDNDEERPFCDGCNIPRDYSIVRKKDPTNNKLYCSYCWSRHREAVFNEAEANEEWVVCEKCGLGCQEGTGRWMPGNLNFYCKLCWRGWISSVPDNRDWIMVTSPRKAKEPEEKEVAGEISNPQSSTQQPEPEATPLPPTDSPTEAASANVE